MGYTPEPWAVLYGDGEVDATIESCDGTIAFVDDTMPDWKGNARLMAHAPELFGLCQEAERFIVDIDEHAGPLTDGEQEFLNRIRQAIAEAVRGE